MKFIQDALDDWDVRTLFEIMGERGTGLFFSVVVFLILILMTIIIIATRGVVLFLLLGGWGIHRFVRAQLKIWEEASAAKAEKRRTERQEEWTRWKSDNAPLV